MDLVGLFLPLVPWKVLGPLRQDNWFPCLNSNWWIVPPATAMKDVKAPGIYHFFMCEKSGWFVFVTFGKSSKKKNCLRSQ